MTASPERESAGGQADGVALALDTYIKLVRAAETVVAVVTRPLAADGLTDGQFGVLEMLWHLGPLSQREIGRRQFRSGGNVTVVVDNLERRGLVHRDRDPDDRRLVNVSLTDTGRHLIERLFPIHARRIAEALAVLSPDQQRALGELARTLGLGQPMR